jgi:hypothetical protein
MSNIYSAVGQLQTLLLSAFGAVIPDDSLAHNP